MFSYLLLVLIHFTSKSLAQGYFLNFFNKTIVNFFTKLNIKKRSEDTYLCKLSSSLFLEKTPYILNTLNQLLCVDGNNCELELNLF